MTQLGWDVYMHKIGEDQERNSEKFRIIMDLQLNKNNFLPPIGHTLRLFSLEHVFKNNLIDVATRENGNGLSKRTQQHLFKEGVGSRAKQIVLDSLDEFKETQHLPTTELH